MLRACFHPTPEAAMEIPASTLQRLASRPDPALPLGRIPDLLEELSPGTGSRAGSAGAALRTATRHPDLLRVVVAWRGPWRALGPDPTTLPPDVRLALERQGMHGGVWLVPLGSPDLPGRARPAVRRLLETVRYLGRVVDVDSPRAVTRWIRIIRETGLVQDPPGGGERSTTPPPDPPPGA